LRSAATACSSVGRTCGGLAVTGQMGIRAVFDRLTEELRHAMAVSGASDLSQIAPDLVRTPDWLAG
jgi:isopentenyl diphosphate isomerase/L-lactate dehydrogenase-like FMN-dependent dehydrogenase